MKSREGEDNSLDGIEFEETLRAVQQLQEPQLQLETCQDPSKLVLAKKVTLTRVIIFPVMQ